MARRTGRMAWGTACLPGAALLLLGGCSGPTGPVAAVESAAARWAAERPESYSYVYDYNCFCPVVGPLRLTVAGDSVISAEWISEPPDASAAPEPWMTPTIEELFDRLRASAEADPVQFDVTYDETLGYPTGAAVDISRQIADEEYSFEVRDLVPVEP